MKYQANRFHSFDDTITNELHINLLNHFAPHVHYVATLPCKVSHIWHYSCKLRLFPGEVTTPLRWLFHISRHTASKKCHFKPNFYSTHNCQSNSPNKWLECRSQMNTYSDYITMCGRSSTAQHYVRKTTDIMTAANVDAVPNKLTKCGMVSVPYDSSGTLALQGQRSWYNSNGTRANNLPKVAHLEVQGRESNSRTSELQVQHPNHYATRPHTCGIKTIHNFALTISQTMVQDKMHSVNDRNSQSHRQAM